MINMNYLKVYYENIYCEGKLLEESRIESDFFKEFLHIADEQRRKLDFATRVNEGIEKGDFNGNPFYALESTYWTAISPISMQLTLMHSIGVMGKDEEGIEGLKRIIKEEDIPDNKDVQLHSIDNLTLAQLDAIVLYKEGNDLLLGVYRETKGKNKIYHTQERIFKYDEEGDRIIKGNIENPQEFLKKIAINYR
ncbi:MAG: hypothetical protein KAK00_06650 [Nanoarchaeota archaeon]|nr:hypothetical protein [Nanoarchaeota archaeon]